MPTSRTGRAVHLAALVSTGFTTLSAAAGGIALIWGSLDPAADSVILPPPEYLQGSPFASYLVPGIALLLGIAATHGIAFVMLVRRSRWAFVVLAGVGYACLVWIFVQMTIIPFSPLQALYFGIGCLEIGLALLAAGVWPSRAASAR